MIEHVPITDEPPTSLQELQDSREALLFMLEDLEVARQQIERSHQEWVAALDVVNDPIFLHDKQFRILRCNKAYQRCAGMPFTQLIGQPYYEIFPKAGTRLPCCLRAMEQAAAEEEEEEEEEVVVGSVTYRSRAFPVHDGQGGYLYSVHILEDITEHKRMVATVVESEEKYRQLFEHSFDALMTLAPPGWRFASANQAALVLFGAATVEDFTAFGLCDVSPDFQPDGHSSGQKAQAMIAKAMQEGSHFFEWTHRRLNGQPFFANVLLTRMQVGAGVFLQATVRDITERKRAQENLRRSEEKFSSLFHVSPAGITITSIADGKFIEVNEAFLTMFERSREEVIGHTSTELNMLTPEDRGRLIGRQIESGGLRNDELLSRVKSGREINLLFSSKPMQVDGEDCLVTTLIDISERKRAEKLLRESQRLTQGIIDGSASLIYSLDREGRFTLANKGLLNLLKIPSEQLLGHSRETILPKEVAEGHRNNDLEVMSKQTAIEFEERNLQADGEHVYLSQKFPLFDSEGKVTGVCGISTDITERKRAEVALRHFNRALRTLSAGNQSLILARDEPQLLQAMCQAAVEKGGYRMAWVGYVEQNAERSIRTMAKAGLEGGYLEKAHLTWADTERGQGPTGRAVRSGKTQVAQDIAHDPTMAVWRDEAAELGYASAIALPLLDEGRCFGVWVLYATEMEAFDTDEVRLLEEMAGDLAFGIHTQRIRVAHREHEQRLQENMLKTVKAIAGIVEMRDPYTSGHQARVAELAQALGRKLGLSEAEVHAIFLAGLVHDLGKVRIPAEILSKPGRLDDVEFSLIKKHAQAGYDILKDIDFSWPIAQMVLQHHERMDGSGYPQGLRGDAILLGARILCVADVVEAMSSHRPYRPGLGIPAALAELERGRGTVYDPQVVDACLTLFNEKEYVLPH